MKLKIMIMALLLLAGIGSAANRLPATEFVGDVNFGGNNITNWGYPKTFFGYDAIIYTDGSNIYALESDGSLIATDTAGTDDAAIISAACDYLSTNGLSSLYISTGTYYTDSEISPPSTIYVRGAGDRATIITPTVAIDSIINISQNYTKISDVFLLGNNSMASKGVKCTAQFLTVEDIFIQDVDYGIYLNDTENGILQNVNMYNVSYGYFFANNGRNTFISGGALSKIHQWGVHVTDRDTTPEGIIFRDLLIYPSPGTGDGVFLESQTGTAEIQVTNCIIDGCNLTGILLGNNSKYTKLAHNYIHCVGAPSIGIDINATSIWTTITSNTFYDVDTAIHLEKGAKQINAVSNSFVEIDTAIVDDDGATNFEAVHNLHV